MRCWGWFQYPPTHPGLPKGFYPSAVCSRSCNLNTGFRERDQRGLTGQGGHLEAVTNGVHVPWMVAALRYAVGTPGARWRCRPGRNGGCPGLLLRSQATALRAPETVTPAGSKGPWVCVGSSSVCGSSLTLCQGLGSALPSRLESFSKALLSL